MKLKEIWAFIKGVVWPAAKPFICASKEEAAELTRWAKDMRSVSNRMANEYDPGGDHEEIYPEFVIRCIEALENENE